MMQQAFYSILPTISVSLTSLGLKMQTGSGKTYTMLGEIEDLELKPSPQRGMTPRIFEFLFARIQAVIVSLVFSELLATHFWFNT